MSWHFLPASLLVLLQTNSYVVPRDKRAEHARLMLRFRQCFKRLGSVFEVYEQTGPNFTGESGGRFVQIMRFRDRHHQQEVHEKEQLDPVAQQLIADFCQLVNITYQQQHGLFAASYYAGILRDRPSDKPELLVTGESEDTIGEMNDLEAAEPPIDARISGEEDSPEATFGPYLRQSAAEYEVEQQIQTMDPLQPDQSGAALEAEPRGRRAGAHHAVNPRSAPT